MAALCQNFVQNAWKKDLCSNCFKSKEEHCAGKTSDGGNKTRYHSPAVAMTRTYYGHHSWKEIVIQNQTNSIKSSAAGQEDSGVLTSVQLVKQVSGSDGMAPADVQGILKDGSKGGRRKSSVCFPDEVEEVIGYGGEDNYSSDEQDVNSDMEDSEDDYRMLSEEERALDTLTQKNTDFNSVNSNLLKDEPKRAFTQLLLGKSSGDGDSKKSQTVLVSIKPFKRDVMPGELKISLVSPMINGQIITVRREKSDESSTDDDIITRDGEDCNNGELVLQEKIIEIIDKTESREQAGVPDGQADPDNEIPPELPRSPPPSIDIHTTPRSSFLHGPATPDKPPIAKNKPKVPVKPSKVPPSTHHIVFSKPQTGETALKSNKIDSEDEIKEVPAKPVERTVTIEYKPVVTPVKSETDDKKTTVNSESEFARKALDFQQKLQASESTTLLVGTCTSEVVNSDNSIPQVKKEDNTDAQSVESKEETADIDAGVGSADLPATENSGCEAPISSSPAEVDDVCVTKIAEPETCSSEVKTKEEVPKVNEIKDEEDVGKSENKEDTKSKDSDSSGENCEGRSEKKDCSRGVKRQAPQPPCASQDSGDSSGSSSSSPLPLYARNSAPKNSDCPVEREKEKRAQQGQDRERSSSCSPKFRKALLGSVSYSPAGSDTPKREPRSRSLTRSEDTSAPGEKCSRRMGRSGGFSPNPGSPPSSRRMSRADLHEREKKKKGRFSLRKFLRLGSKDDKSSKDHHPEKPRPEIIHPIDLNHAGVEVIHGSRTDVSEVVDGSPAGSTRSNTSSSTDQEQPKNDEVSQQTDASGTQSQCNGASNRPKPPPPPRNQSLDGSGKGGEGITKPARPPPPKSAELLRQQKQAAWNNDMRQPSQSIDSVYANLGPIAGEVRSGLTPSKPQRSSSLREPHQEGPKRSALRAVPGSLPDDSGYESVEFAFGSATDDNMYESVARHRTCTPECESPPSEAGVAAGKQAEKIRFTKNCTFSSNSSGLAHRASDSGLESSISEFAKYRGFVRSASLPYCASEVDSEVYTPYSFMGSEDGGDEDIDGSSHSGRISRLRLKKGRSIVHKNLEDNYGAVIVANHEALAQVLEQVYQTFPVPAALRGLKTASNLCWSDFSVNEETSTTVGRKVFYPAMWGMHQVTLSVSLEGSQSSMPARNSFSLLAVTEFSDLIPSKYLAKTAVDTEEQLQASVGVHSKMQVDTIQSYADLLALAKVNDELSRDVCFILLQLINGLKYLQAQGIEDAPVSLSNFVLCREEKDPNHRLHILYDASITFNQLEEDSENSNENKVSLCQCALIAMFDLFKLDSSLIKSRTSSDVKQLLNTVPSYEAFSIMAQILLQEKAVSLSQVKSILEYMLWGPSDIIFETKSGPKEREQALQRWLDLERATVLNNLIKTQGLFHTELTVFEEYQLLFLVRTCAKMLREASMLLDSQARGETTNF